ncbi:MAG: UDP-N-acetylmuramate dehydrogenase [Flavobacteriaceae bacterium]|nr:UDP-N-acetylmuramate dehydrogenase [Flavobacteriaceae bacterium]
MKIQQNISLKPYNTFGIAVNAQRYIDIASLNELKELLSTEKDFFILSGGSNLLLTKDIEKLVVHLNTKGIEVLHSDENDAFIKVQAGENWHVFVLWCIDHNYGGVENLSLIPGNVGTTPIQNIGAYGVEVKDTIHEVEGLKIENNTSKIFTNKDCEFDYRDSIFKNEQKDNYIITSVTFKLTKNHHKLNSSYGAIQSELEKNNIKNTTIKDISDAVITIRQSKLPDPKEIGNSGSFFKNSVISKEQFEKLQEKHLNMPFYEVKGNKPHPDPDSYRDRDVNRKSKILYKVPAGWLVEQCGFKGKRFGDAGVHKNQALVLVNYGNATGKEIWELAQKIQKAVLKKFGIALEAEVNII